MATIEQGKVSPRMGLSLYPTFIAAGLPPPELRLECAVGGGVLPAVSHLAHWEIYTPREC